MNKLKLFLENFIVYGIGGVISKIIPLFMVPIVTRIMPNTDYYGISDLSNTVVQFGIINYTLIPVLGIEGASIATLFGYIIANIVCVIVLIKMNLIVINKRFLTSLLLLIIYMITWRFIFKTQTVVGVILASIVLWNDG